MINIGSQIVSKLGSPNSRIPLAAKDIFNSVGYTYFSYDAGGKIEGKDRFVDEIGTGALWLFGIPAYKKLIDKTVFKKAGISPEVDVRVVKDNNYLQKALENAPTEKIYKEIKKAGSNVNKTKSLTILKFVMALGLTMLSYFGLTKVKHNMTKKNIEKEFLDKQINKSYKQNINPYNKNNPVFADFIQNTDNNTNTKENNINLPSFKSSALTKAAEDFMLNPVKNMVILDTCISGERLANSRTKGEFKEYAVKEGSFLFFVYGADKIIKKGIDKFSQSVLKAPIRLDANFLSSDLAEKVLTDKSMQEEIKTFGENFAKNSDTSALYDFIFKNQHNTVVEAAKKSGIISTAKNGAGKTKIDTRKYIDPKQISELVNDLQIFINSSKNAKDLNKYLKKVKALKVGSTLINIGICCLALGYMVPKYIYKKRAENQDGKNDFHVKTEYEKELAKKHSKTL